MEARRKLAIGLVLTGVWVFFFLPAEAGMVLKFNHPFVPGAPADRAAELFVQNVNKKAKGELEIQLFKAAQLGDVLGTYRG